jgi:hypothetical protein
MNIPNPKSYYEWKHPEEERLVFDNIIFPLIRRVAAQVVGLDLVAVQPMVAPVGRLMFPMGGNWAERRSILDFDKPIPYKNWKQRKEIAKKWSESGVLDGITGLRGQQVLDPGYIYAPYVPVMLTPTIEERDFAPRRQLSSRYAIRMVNNNFYGTINVSGAPVE